MPGFFQGLQWEICPYKQVWCVYVCHSCCLHLFTCVIFPGPSVGRMSIWTSMVCLRVSFMVLFMVFKFVVFPGPSVGSTSIWTSMVCLRVSFMVFTCVFFFRAFSGRYVHMNEYGVFTCVIHGVYMCCFFRALIQWEVCSYERVWCVYVCHSWCLHVFTCVIFSGPSVGSTSIWTSMVCLLVFTFVVFPGPSVGSTSIWTSMVCLLVFTFVVFPGPSVGSTSIWTSMVCLLVFTFVVFPGPSVGSTSIWTSMVCLRVSFMMFTCVYVCYFFRAFSGKYVHMNEYGVFTCVIHDVYMCLRVLFFQGLQWEVRPYEWVWCVYVCHSWCLHVFTFVVFSRAFSGKYVHMHEYGVFTSVIHGVYLCLRLLFFPGPSVGSTSIWTSMVCLRVLLMVFTCV